MSIIRMSLILTLLAALAFFGLLLFDIFNDELEPALVNASAPVIAVQIPECKNLDLILTSQCLHRELTGLYNFQLRDDIDRTLEDIKTYGGDCYDYNLLYKKWLEALGFHAEMKYFQYDEEAAHIITFAYDKGSYCILDQTVDPHCVILGGDSDGF